MKLNSKNLILYFSVISLAVFEQFHIEVIYSDALADDSKELQMTEVSTTSSENPSQESEDDYFIPKTVYIGVDSIAAPEELPETAALPLPAEALEISIEEQSRDSSRPIAESEVGESSAVAKPTEVSAPVDSPEITENESVSPESEVVSQKDEPLLPTGPTDSLETVVDTQSAASLEPTVVHEVSELTVNTVVNVSAQSPLESQKAEPLTSAESLESAEPVETDKSTDTGEQLASVKTDSTENSPKIETPGSVESDSENITLFNTIEVSPELNVPFGLPEDLNEGEDYRDALSSTTSSTSNDDQSGGIVEQASQGESPEEFKKPAIVVNINDNLQIDSQDEWGWTKLMSAAIEGDIEKVNELLELGANPGISGEDGRSPLMAASWNKHYAVVEALINARADVNLSNRDGWTALSFAAWNGDIVIVNSLLRVSANKYLKTADGFTPLQLAEQKGHQKIIDLLK